MGHIVYFHVEEWAFANEYKHAVGISSIFPDSIGTRLVFCDIKSQAYVYDAVSLDRMRNNNQLKNEFNF